MRVLIDDKVIYNGDAIPVPRVGDTIEHDGESLPIEAVNWDLEAQGTVSVTLLLGSRAYAY